ncbi:hypothetical protein [uncultured Methanobrevibacter sp.]|uniref:hypothetical protein n=1 Tax=uncultured Methanobrevibacter sp. TaxID=253161 RepID=UPI002606E52B|nr:hypothetical protein [uncultured Methanobrevibacter sp.]
MDDKEIINVDDINYAIYKIGNWKNNYEINQIGLSSEIPVTKNTLTHVKLSMEEIRHSEFSISDKKVNGFVAIAMQLNPKVQEMELDDIIALEEKEFENISKELDELDLMADGETIPLENEDYLIYKLEKNHHVTSSIPANEFTKEFYKNELKKIEDALD